MKTFKEFILIESDLTKQELTSLEKRLDILFNKVGLDIEFTKHFFKRVNDNRNGKPITSTELMKLYDAEYEKYAKVISNKRSNFQAILNDMTTDINIPFVLQWNKQKDKMELVAKTIMRKQDFKSSNEKYKVKT